MQKKIFSFYVILLLSVLFSLSVGASEISETDPPQNIGVYAKSIDTSSSENVSKATFHDGSTTVTINGVAFKFNSSVADGTVLTVVSVSAEDQEAYRWIKGSLNKTEADLIPFYVRFSYGGETVKPLYSVSVSVGKAIKKADTLYYLSTDGSSEILSSSLNKTVTFSAQGNGYYVVSTRNSSENDVNVPDTGDKQTSLVIPIVLMVLSTMTIAALMLKDSKYLCVLRRSDKENV